MSSQAALTIHPASADLLRGAESEAPSRPQPSSPTSAYTRASHGAETPTPAALPRQQAHASGSSYARPRQRRWGALAVVGTAYTGG